MLPYNLSLKPLASNLRNRPTTSEYRLWRHLRLDQIEGVRFYRQKILANYIVDFYSRQAKLIIELDGSQHFNPDNEYDDMKRDNYFQNHGYQVLRYSNLDVTRNIEGVMHEIHTIVKERTGKR